MVYLIIIIALLAFLTYIISDKAKENEHDWLVIPVIIIFFLFVVIMNLKSCVTSDDSSSYDYYDERAQ